MPKSPVPVEFRDLLESTELAHLATVDAHGKPQVNPIWFIWDGTHLLLGVQEATAKYRNLRRNPHLAVSILDPGNPFRYIELRGKVIDFHLYEDLSFVNELSRKYTGKDYPPESMGLRRYRLTVEIDSWTGH
jgi:PPOX class probable F420-dependent enzyme